MSTRLKQLPQISDNAQVSGLGEAAAQTVERVFAAAFSNEGQNPTNQPEMSFTELGLDSLDMNRVADGLSQAFGIQISPVVLFEYPSVQLLVAHLSGTFPDTANEGTIKMTGKEDTMKAAAEAAATKAAEKMQTEDKANAAAVSKTKKLEKTETSKATAGKAAAATTKQTASPASPAEAVSAFTGPWICGLGHPDGQDSQTSTANQRVSIECEAEAPETQSTECEVEMGAPAASSHGSKAKLSNPQPAKLSPTVHAGVTVPTQMVASVYTIRKVLKSEVAGLAVFANTNSVVLADASAVMTEHKEHSQVIYALAATPRMASTSGRSPLGAVKSALVSSPQVRRLLIRELLNASEESRMTCNEDTPQLAAVPPGLINEVAMRNVSEEPRMTCDEVGLQKGIRPRFLARRRARRRPSTEIRETFDNQDLCNSPTQTPDIPLMKMGINSQEISKLASGLSSALGVPVSPVLLYNYPTLNSLLNYFRGLSASEDGAPEQLDLTVPRSPISEIALVAASYSLPGGIHSPSDLVAALASASDKIGRVPQTRWDVDSWFALDEATKLYTDQSGFVEFAQCFDHEYFAISAAEVQRMDPQQRLMLQHTTSALMKAHPGCQISDFKEKQVAVFVGCSHHDWERERMHVNNASPYNTTGTATSVLAGRLSFELGLTGPSMVVDTACSSSLVSCGMGYEHLQTGACSQAVIGGVNLILDPMQSVLYCQTRMLSINGRYITVHHVKVACAVM